MQFAVLGSLQVIAGDFDEPGTVSAARPRVLLAVLLWRANQPVPPGELADLVWDGVPPAGAPEATRALVMRLRRQLDKRVAARIVTRAPGYAIEISGDELDASWFETLTQQAGAAVRVGQWAQAARIAAQALELWRGTPLTDVGSQLLRDQWVPHLERLRTQALEWRIEADLHEGRHQQLVPELQALTSVHPLREHFHGQLMLALYRCGRQAEALAAYTDARKALDVELGVEPGPGLRDLHQLILSGDPALAITGPAQPTQAEPQQVTPRELPPGVPGFTGRSAELRALTRLLDRSGDPRGGAADDPLGKAAGEQAPGTVVISAIGGTAGVGKTALAVHWAHQAAGRFPDGQLYVNLRGYDPSQPMTAADALAGFLRSLGVPGQDIPPEEDQRAARYRSLLAGKRMLIVLDNAGSAEQVRPLLPGTPACAVVVTSRDALAGLVARDGAARLDLDVFPHQDAIALLRTLIGVRVDGEPRAAAELAAQCCRLPLALRVAAVLTASRPGATLAELTAELADLRTRLDLLAAGGDSSTEVRTVFSWSYRHLDASAAATFRLLGLHPGPDFEPYAAAALAGIAVPQARQILDALTRSHLIQLTAPGRYGMHDLLRGYAYELTTTLDTDQNRHTALTRLFDHYLYLAGTAMDILFPAEHHRRPRIPRPATQVPSLADPAAARDWLDRERTTLVAATAYTANHEWPAHTTRLATTLSRHLLNSGHLPEALAIYGHALEAARRIGDHATEATVLIEIGHVEGQQSRYRQAADYYRQALALFRETGYRTGEARALGGIGLAETQLGRYEQATRHQYEAVAIYRHIGDRFGEVRSLSNLGVTWQLQGRHAEAAGYQHQALDLSREIGDQAGEAWARTRLGIVDLHLGRYLDAARYLRQALDLFQEMGHAGGECEIRARLGDVYLGLRRHKQAVSSFEQAIAMSREIGDRLIEAEALNGLARAYHADGDLPVARHHWREALTLFAAIGAPDADDVRARLAAAGGGTGRGGDSGEAAGEPLEAVPGQG